MRPQVSSGCMKTVKFFTLGCKVNQYDTQAIREKFLKKGFREPQNQKPADIYLINTCTVTQTADRKSQELIRRSIKVNPKALVIVTGCMVEKDSAQLGKIRGLSLIVSKSFFAPGISDFSLHTRAFLKIQDGCNNFCSYCKVPLVRGSSRSRPLAEIVSEAKELVNSGFKEIVLTGICLGAYGDDLRPKVSIVGLIKKLEAIDGLLRIRLSSIEAGDITKDLIKAISGSKKLCRHLHIPIQSGDTQILKKMNRKYSRLDYLRLIQRIKKQVCGIAITTDVLVGFPGETENNFLNTLELVKKIKPLRTHIFPYSLRLGTKAALIVDANPDRKTVNRRIDDLKLISQKCANSFKRSFLNKILDVLIEEKSKDYPGFWYGHSDNYLKVLVKSQADLKNKLIRVKIRRILGEDCVGEFSCKGGV